MNYLINADVTGEYRVSLEEMAEYEIDVNDQAEAEEFMLDCVNDIYTGYDLTITKYQVNKVKNEMVIKFKGYLETDKVSEEEFERQLDQIYEEEYLLIMVDDVEYVDAESDREYWHRLWLENGYCR